MLIAIVALIQQNIKLVYLQDHEHEYAESEIQIVYIIQSLLTKNLIHEILKYTKIDKMWPWLCMNATEVAVR